MLQPSGPSVCKRCAGSCCWLSRALVFQQDMRAQRLCEAAGTPGSAPVVCRVPVSCWTVNENALCLLGPYHPACQSVAQAKQHNLCEPRSVPDRCADTAHASLTSHRTLAPAQPPRRASLHQDQSRCCTEWMTGKAIGPRSTRARRPVHLTTPVTSSKYFICSHSSLPARQSSWRCAPMGTRTRTYALFI
jgi:hypothetical protein